MKFALKQTKDEENVLSLSAEKKQNKRLQSITPLMPKPVGT